MSYKCCGCGAEWPDGKNLYCHCPTDVLYTSGSGDVGNLKSILIMDDNPKLASKLAGGPRWLEAIGKMLSALGDTKFMAGVAVGVATVLFAIHFDLARDGRADWMNGSIEYVEETK